MSEDGKTFHRRKGQNARKDLEKWNLFKNLREQRMETEMERENADEKDKNGKKQEGEDG